MEEAEATQFLESLLGKTLHVTVPDGKATGEKLGKSWGMIS